MVPTRRDAWIVASFMVCLLVGALALATRSPLLLALTVLAFWVLLWPWEASDIRASRLRGYADSADSGQRQEIAALSDEDFDKLVDETERAARAPERVDQPVAQGVGALDEADFAQLVRDALDELPAFVRHELDAANVAVTVSDAGREHHAYGLYVGGSRAYDDYAHQILIFRDTLTRDFGADRDELRHQVTTTVRHEVAHHLGANERHVEELGL